MLTIVAGGVIAGAWLGQMSSPVMQFAAQPEWRAKFHDRLEPQFSATPLQFVAAGPEDLSPFGWAPGAMAAVAASQSWHDSQAWREVQSDPVSDQDPDRPALDETEIQEASYTAEAAAHGLADEIVRIEPPPLTAAAREPISAAALTSPQ